MLIKMIYSMQYLEETVELGFTRADDDALSSFSSYAQSGIKMKRVLKRVSALVIVVSHST